MSTQQIDELRADFKAAAVFNLRAAAIQHTVENDRDDSDIGAGDWKIPENMRSQEVTDLLSGAVPGWFCNGRRIAEASFIVKHVKPDPNCKKRKDVSARRWTVNLYARDEAGIRSVDRFYELARSAAPLVPESVSRELHPAARLDELAVWFYYVFTSAASKPGRTDALAHHAEEYDGGTVAWFLNRNIFDASAAAMSELSKAGGKMQQVESPKTGERSAAMSKAALARKIMNSPKARPREVDWERFDLQRLAADKNQWTVSTANMDKRQRMRVLAPKE